MTAHSSTTPEKIAEVERLIEAERRHTGRRNEVLREIAADYRANLDPAPSYARRHLADRLNAVLRSKTALGYDGGQLMGLAQELIGRWPVVRRALELFAALIERGENPTEEAFRLGFEHAIAGGEEAAKAAGIPLEAVPLVLYFETEDGRQALIEAIRLDNPASIEVKIPERRR